LNGITGHPGRGLGFLPLQYVERSLEVTENWIIVYNEERPHDSLGKKTPAGFEETRSPQNVSTYGWHQLVEIYRRSKGRGNGLNLRVLKASSTQGLS
jgi:hypothetical protein